LVASTRAFYVWNTRLTASCVSTFQIIQQNLTPTNNIFNFRKFLFVMAYSIPARDKKHPRRADIHKIHGVMTGAARHGYVRYTQFRGAARKFFLQLNLQLYRV
jgi:hypothetical protein